jgi:TRAP-type transport system small permease protein
MTERNEQRELVMRIKNWINALSKIFNSTNEVLAWVGYVTLVFIIAIVFIDVFGRYFLNKPLVGTFELVESTMTIVSGVAIMYATMKRGHVMVDLLFAKFPRRVQVIVQSTFSLLGFITWLMLAYLVYTRGIMVVNSSRTLNVLPISPAIFMLAFAATALICSLALLIQTFQYESADETVENMEKSL